MKFLKSMSDEQVFDALIQENSVDGALLYLGRVLEKASKKFGQKTAIIFEASTMSYAQLYARSVALSKKLMGLGIKPKDRVLLLVPNSIEFYVGCFGILQMGAVVVPLNTFLRERELNHVISDAKPTCIITTSELVPVLNNCGVPLPKILTETDLQESATDQELNVFIPADLDCNEMACLLYTSGTTGVPKGVMLSSNNIIYNVLQTIARFRPKEHDSVFAVLPLFHSFAQNTCVWTPLFIGTTIILVPKIDRRAILKALEHKPSIFLGVPALFGLMCLLQTKLLAPVKIFVSGGDAMPDKIRNGFELLYHRKICSGYGMTEASPVISCDFDDEAMPTSAVGRLLPGIIGKFMNDQGQESARGQIGQLWVKGPNVMLGYYNAPDMTAAVLHDGWLDTGDLAYLDEKGRIVITGRIKDIIKHKGFIIYPQEIENILLLHPNVIRAGVIGKPDPEVGEVTIAFVQLKKDDGNIQKTLKELCTKNLAPYKIPRLFITTVEDLPTTVTGKVDKKVLRKKVHEN